MAIDTVLYSEVVMCDQLLIYKSVRLPGYGITAQVGKITRKHNNRIENVLYLQPQEMG